MSAELIAAIGAVIVSIGGTLFNYYKLKDDQKTWEQEHRISIEKKVLFKRLKKRHKLYHKIFTLLGYVRDIEYPIEHHQEISQNKEKLKQIADDILVELYGESGLFMEYTTRSLILKTYQISYKYTKGEATLPELIDSYYYARRAIRMDLEFDDTNVKTNKDNIIEVTSSEAKRKEDLMKKEKIWTRKDILAHSARPGYPNKIVSMTMLNETVNMWQEVGIKSILCLLSNEEIKMYYQIINGDLISFYKSKGFHVHHISVTDFQTPPLTKEEIFKVDSIYQNIKKPFIIHCGAGEDRTGQATEYLLDKYNL